MCDLDLETCDVWSETERKARKTHRCSACGATIRPGDRYLVHFSKYDEGVSSEKVCLACRDAREEFANAHDGMSPTPSYFVTLLEECIADGDEESERMWRPMLTALRARGPAPRPASGEGEA